MNLREKLKYNFIPPIEFTHTDFYLEVLAPKHNKLDYEAWSSCKDELKGIFGPRNKWPANVSSLDTNLKDLLNHFREFRQKEAFTYTILNIEKTKCIGCLYIRPTKSYEHDCHVDFWFRNCDKELEKTFYSWVQNWLRDIWHFKKTAFPGREIQWETYYQLGQSNLKKLHDIKLENTYSKLPEHFYESVMPATFKKPELICFNYDLAQDLGINCVGLDEVELAQYFSGKKLFSASQPIAAAYAAHQFAHFVPQLGDGRAHLLGDLNGHDIQLKGSGRTHFSRNGDGRSALGPVLREYIVSEAMFHLGVPTTRALCAVTTGEDVYRNTLEPGGIFTRVAPSHIRVGTFQYFMNINDLEGIQKLLEYSIKRHYPHLDTLENISQKALSFIESVGEAQAKLISKWMALGFIHGVMNTDNFTVGGFTIDFGPCAFMDEYKKDKVFSSIDRNARYSYNNQMNIAQWNILRLADCLLPLIHNDQNKAIASIEKLLPSIRDQFQYEYEAAMLEKIGITNHNNKDMEIINEFLEYLEAEQLDFTLAFRSLPNLYKNDTSQYPNVSKLNIFLKKWKERVCAHDILNLSSINPLFIPRNHQIEKAIKLANEGDYSVFNELTEMVKRPFQENLKCLKYSVAPKKEERVSHTFCGT